MNNSKKSSRGLVGAPLKTVVRAEYYKLILGFCMMDFVTNYGHMISLELQELAAVNFYGCGTKIMDFTVAEAYWTSGCKRRWSA